MTTFAIPVRFDTFLTYYPTVTKTDRTDKGGNQNAHYLIRPRRISRQGAGWLGH